MTIEDAITIFFVALSGLLENKGFVLGVTKLFTPINIIIKSFYNRLLVVLVEFVEHGYYEYEGYDTYESSHAI
jgi:hypothetical protein